ncbi:hypothetical protein AB6Q56_14620 [Dechloromonas sp. ARDL1]|uniref:hypothetical protein n=1 Tax=Dechloromonas sp. ARDL1 TaxID=3322121 RepID=UPI003DA7085F
MQEKIIEILSVAKDWMTASELADKGKWRSPAHVGLALKQMTGVEHRTSPTKKMDNGMPAKEYKLVDKSFQEQMAVIRKNRTTEPKMPIDKECCNAAKVVATTASQEVSELRNRISELELDATRMLEYLGEKNQRIEALEEEIGQRNREIEKLIADRNSHRDDVMLWERTMMKMVGEDGVGSVSRAISTLQSDLGHARIQIDALNEQLMAGEEAVDVKDAARGYLVCAPKRKPAKLMKAESAVARAKSAAKATGRGEVFALVPVGVATRKQIRAVEFKERAA